jgi:hypothetical protein
MPYAHRDTIYDADTHMMETPDWITRFADPARNGANMPNPKRSCQNTTYRWC